MDIRAAKALNLFTLAFISLLWTQGAYGSDVRITIYADGKSCPANCDAHVVFDKDLNGTEFAHAPYSDSLAYTKCTKNSSCEICFSSNRQQCIVVMYRGAGPSKNTFDFTPAFFELHCTKTNELPSLEKKCDELRKGASVLKGRINCIRNTDHDLCEDLMAQAQALRDADLLNYQRCNLIGAAQFNKTQPTRQQRSKDCAYEAHGTGGPNSKGTTWRKLLPAACHPNAFVGRDGLDCCTGNRLTDGGFSLECRPFYPKQ